MKMDDLTDLLHGPAAPASPEVFQQLGAITRLLHDTMQQLGVMPKLQVAADGIPDAQAGRCAAGRPCQGGGLGRGLQLCQRC